MAMNIRLTDEEQDLLDEMALEAGVSKNDIVRRALVEKAVRDGHRQRVEQSLDWALTRYDDVLKRLGEA